MVERTDLEVRHVQTIVAEDFGITREMLLSKRRARAYCYPRMLAMHIAREATALSYPALAARFGGVHHTSVMHACGWARESAHYRQYIDVVLNELRGEDDGQG